MTADPAPRRDDRQRATATAITDAVADEVALGHPADTTLTRIFREHPEFGGRDRRRYRHALFCFFRWRGWIETAAPHHPEAALALAVHLDPTSDDAQRALWSPVLDTPPLGATLARLRAAWHPDTPDPACPLDALMPDWLPTALPEPRRSAFIRACATRPPTWLRAAPDRIAALLDLLAAHQITATPDPRLPGAIAVHTPFQQQQLEKAAATPLHIQDIASQAVGLVAAAQPGQRWWDACSGAGGKALLLAEAVGPSGAVTATDTRESILRNLLRRAAAHGFPQLAALPLDATREHPPGAPFDGVLIDAPCSGLGTWSRNPDARWRTPASAIATCRDTQRALLEHAADAVRPGGLLVYAVCTLTDSEGPDQLRAFLQTRPDFSPLPFPDPLGRGTAPGECRIDPADGPGDGMYIARLMKAG